MLPVLFMMGCRQVVRQGTLNPSLGGSNPSTPAIETGGSEGAAGFNSEKVRMRTQGS